MAEAFSEYQKRINRLITQHPDAVPVVQEILAERLKEVNQLWLRQIEVPEFDEVRLRGYHKGATEVTKFLRDLESALRAFRDAAQAQGDGNAKPDQQ